jgi:hypothetical protein
MLDHSARQRGLDKRKQAKAAQTAATEHLPGGWLLYPDTTPGVGWVLAPPSTDEHGVVTPGRGDRKRYYATPEAAKAWLAARLRP